MPEVTLGNVPAKEAIEHIRAKLAVPTKRWDDMLGEVHVKAFTVAGATKLDLLKDLHGAVATAIEKGQSINQFRQQFDKTVAKHGWEYKGTRGWRTRVIYDTNLRTAHMAGRHKQVQRVKKKRPFQIYMTVGDQQVRPEHAAWHKLVLPVDDPWWDTHYPPNGWGCRCYINTANQRQLDRQGLSPAKAPKIETSQRINTGTGEDYGQVPNGIDVGWNYNVGKAWLGPDIAFGNKLASVPTGMANAGIASVNFKVLDKDFKKWATDSLGAHSRGKIKTVGFLSPELISGLKERGLAPATAAITITDRRINHMVRDRKVTQGKQLPDSVLVDLPRHIRNAKAVLLDTRKNSLIFVLDHQQKDRVGKAVVFTDFVEKGELTNSVRSGGLVPIDAFEDTKSYTLLEGKL